MITDVRASEMFLFLRRGHSVASVARSLKMSERTVRKYRDAHQLPSQVERPAREYRTRLDPLVDYWDEIEALLRADHRIKPYAILAWLKQKYNDPSAPARVTDEIRRTLERRVLRWKLEHGVEQEVHFPQVHHPGDVIAFDFVNMNPLRITLDGKVFKHLLFHAVFTYSNWEYVHVCHSESFEALSSGLQDALHQAGGVPRRIRSDSLSAAVKNLSSDKEFAAQYRDLLRHYGVDGHRINVRKPHENGDVESLHGHWKDSLDQSLRLRGNRDFPTRQAYIAYLRDHAQQRNAVREKLSREECAALTPLPRVRCDTHTPVAVTVKSDCILHIKRNIYSVSSKYIGLRVEVRIHQDHLELWHHHECLERLPRQFGSGNEAVDFRHVIDSLRRKPGAFLNYKYVNHLYPTTRFRMAYDQLLQSHPERTAIKEYLELLYAAKYEGLDVVDEALRVFLSEGRPIQAKAVVAHVKSDSPVASPTDVQVDAPDLSLFDCLLSHKDVTDDEESDFRFHCPNLPDLTEGGELSAYDRYGPTAGATQGLATPDLSRALPGDGRPSGAGKMDSHPVSGGTGGQGMPVPEPQPHSTPDAECEFTAREELGSVQLGAATAACHPAVRDLAAGGLSRPPGQCLDLRATRFGQDIAPVLRWSPIPGPPAKIELLNEFVYTSVADFPSSQRSDSWRNEEKCLAPH